MLEETLTELQQSAVTRLNSATTPEELEQIRVEALGRKGTLSNISKEMGRIPAEDRARIGKLLNQARESLEAALERRKQQFAAAALRSRLDAEWVDLTLPAPGPRPGSALSRKAQMFTSPWSAPTNWCELPWNGRSCWRTRCIVDDLLARVTGSMPDSTGAASRSPTRACARAPHTGVRGSIFIPSASGSSGYRAQLRYHASCSASWNASRSTLVHSESRVGLVALIT